MVVMEVVMEVKMAVEMEVEMAVGDDLRMMDQFDIVVCHVFRLV